MRATTEKRQPKRERALLHAHIEGDRGQQEVCIRDVSVNGALVETSSQPSIGEKVQLSCGDTSMTGQVAWVDGSWFGLEFATPLTTSTLADTVGNQLRVAAPRSYRHDRIAQADETDEPIEASSRKISLRGRTL